METVANVGPVQFRLSRAARFVLAGFEPTSSLYAGDDLVQVVDDGGGIFLAVDHRREPEAETVSRVELWQPTSPTEYEVSGLLVITDAAGGAPDTPDPCRLSTVARALGATT
jgi:hypothetical protein